MEQCVYLLCALTSILCALLLFRQYRATRGGLLLWSTVCFALLALTNVLLVVDLILLPLVDLSNYRAALALAGMMTLLYGLIREST
jgi:hypothetical protein